MWLAGEVRRERDLLFDIAVLKHDVEFHFNLSMFVTRGHWGLKEGVKMGVTANFTEHRGFRFI